MIPALFVGGWLIGMGLAVIGKAIREGVDYGDIEHSETGRAAKETGSGAKKAARGSRNKKADSGAPREAEKEVT